MAQTDFFQPTSSALDQEDISRTSKTTQNDNSKDGFEITDLDEGSDPDEGVSGPQQDTWGKRDLQTWRNATNARADSVAAEDSEFSIVTNRITLEDTQKGADALKKYHSLVDLRNLHHTIDGTTKGELSRAELQKHLASAYPAYSDGATTALKNFADFSGGTDGISRDDINREMMSALTTAIEVAGKSGKFGFAERNAIANWAQYPGNSEEKLNDALEGTGMKAKFETSKFKNYLGDEIPISTVTLTRDNKEIEKFAYAGGLDSYYSLLGGKEGSGAYDILDNPDPTKTYSPEMTQHLKDVRDLFELTRWSSELKDGEITFQEAADNKERDAMGDHAREYLQNHFASLAVRDQKDGTISKSDLQNALIDSLATLMKDSILRDGLQGSDRVNGMLQDAIGQRNLGHSKKLQDTLNAALEQYGYRTSLTDDPITQSPDSPFHRTLSIYDMKDPSKHKDIGLFITDY